MKEKLNLVPVLIMLLISIVIPANAFSQLTFVKKYDLKTETITLSQPDGTGGLVTAGNYSDGTTGNKNLKVSLTNFDKDGNVNWSGYFDGAHGSMRLISFILADNGDYLLAGYLTPSKDPSAYEVFLLRVNKKGEIVWSKNYFKEYRTVFYSLGKSGDGGFFLYASHGDVPSGLGYITLLKVDGDGSLVWARRYASTWKWGTGTATIDGGFIISNVENIFKVNGNGNVVWSKKYNEIVGRDVNYIKALGDGGFLLALSSVGNRDGFVFKMDKDGNPLWTSLGFIGFINNCLELPQADGSFIISGSCKTNANPAKNIASLVKMNKEGQIMNVIYPREVNLLIHPIVISGDRFFITAQHQAMISLLKTSTFEPTLCMDTTSISMRPAPEVTAINAQMSGVSLDFEVRDLLLQKHALEVKGDTLCYTCGSNEINLGKDTTLCAGEVLVLNAGLGFASYEWSNGEQTSSITINKPGTYWLIVENECGVFKDTIKVDFSAVPEFSYTIDPLIAKPWEPVYFNDNTQKIKSHYWDFGDGNISTSANSQHIYGENGDFEVKLILEDSFGCFYSITENIKVLYQSLYLPNAFSPDGNGVNDTFSCIGYGIMHFHLKIYNRWGELIFDKENQGWDGKYQGKICPAGIYLYQLVAKFEGKNEHRSGYVHLKR